MKTLTDISCEKSSLAGTGISYYHYYEAKLISPLSLRDGNLNRWRHKNNHSSSNKIDPAVWFDPNQLVK